MRGKTFSELGIFLPNEIKRSREDKLQQTIDF